MPSVDELYDREAQTRSVRFGAVHLAADLQRGDWDRDLKRAGSARREIEPVEVELGQPFDLARSARTAGGPASLAGSRPSIHP